MKNIYYLAAVLFLFSCEREMDISSVTIKSRLVVNALLNDQDKISVSVSQSTTIQDSVKPAPIISATVVVTDRNGISTSCIYNIATTRYECAIIPKPGDFYTVNVTASGFLPATAEMTIPSKAGSGQSFWQDSTSMDSLGFPNGTITARIHDNGSEKNYYRVSLFYWHTSLLEWRVLQPILDDAELENQAIKTEDGGIIFKDNTFNGKNRNIRFTTPFGYSFQSPKFLVVIENLSEPYYLYFKSLDDYKQNTWIFNEPIPVYSNINNGVGIFAGSSLQRDTIK